MEFETVRKPIDAFRAEVERLGTSWTKEGRYLGAVALRSSAQRLVATAERLDDLAAKLEPAEPAPPAIEAEADAAAVEAVAHASGPSSPEAQGETAVDPLTASEDATPATDARSVPEAAPSQPGRRRARR